MSWPEEIFYRMRALLRRGKIEREIDEELSFHLDMRTQQNIEAGMSREEARRDALRRFGNVTQIKDKSWDVRGGGMVEILINDLRFGLRMLLKNPGFTAVAVVALALGIGANTAIFSVVNYILLRPLPYVDPERLVFIESGNRQAGPGKLSGVSPADFWDWQEQSEAFEQLAAMSGGGFSLTGVEDPEIIPQSRVSASFFSALKASPLLGRVFSSEDESLKSPDTVVLSHRFWQRRFGGDPAIIGKPLGDTGVTVIGVMPADFKFPSQAECWAPLPRDSGEMRNRANRYFNVIGLVRADQTIESAQAELNAVAGRLEAEHPETNKEIGVRLTLLRDHLVREVKSSLLILFGAVGLVLLIACANVASLLLARAASRRKEMAVRSALGASRARLMRQMLTESLLLSLAGGAIGLLLAVWGRGALTAMMPENYAYLRLEDQAQIDGSVLLFTLVIAVLTGAMFGIIPAWKAARPSAAEWLKESSRSSDGPRHQRTRSVLVVTEIALAVVLLVGAGLLIQSFVRLQQVALGFDPRDLFSVSISTSFAKQPTDAARAQFVKQMLDQVSQTHGVESAAISSGTPFPYLRFNFSVEGNPLKVEHSALYDSVSPNYFRALGAELLAGREFTDRDTAKAPGVAIINESSVRQYFGDEAPLGKRISINYLGQQQTREIVGVVRDLHQGEPGKVLAQMYVPYDQQPWLSATLLVRAAGDLTGLKKNVQLAIWSVDKTQPVAKLQSVEEALGNSLAEPRLYMTLLGVFAGLALALATIGIYGVMAYSVTQRRHEIGIRMALGARSRDVIGMVLRQGLLLAATGVVFGLAIAFAATRLLASLLYGVSATDPTTFLFIPLLFIGVAVAACLIPARKASKVDPVIALKYDQA